MVDILAMHGQLFCTLILNYTQFNNHQWLLSHLDQAFTKEWQKKLRILKQILMEMFFSSKKVKTLSCTKAG